MNDAVDTSLTGTAKLARTFARCRDEGRAALITFLAAGDPDLDTTQQAVRAAQDAGADIIELGVPFGDALADGPIIQDAYTRALAGGASVARVLESLGRIIQDASAPVVLMTSYNPVLAYRVPRFCSDAASAGAAALLIPDLLPEDAGEVDTYARACGLATVFLAAPGSTDGRIERAARASTGFVYLLSRRGITGVHQGVGAELEPALARVRRYATVPVAVGFGISGAVDAARVAAIADGVIVGSTLVRTLHEAFTGMRERGATVEQSREEACRALGERVQVLASAVRTARVASGAAG